MFYFYKLLKATLSVIFSAFCIVINFVHVWNLDSMTCSATDDFICVSSGACIHRAQVCDGAMHCSDGSDEANCSMLV